MTITIDMEPEAEARLRDLAAREGRGAEEWIKQFVETHLPLILARPTTPPAWLAELKPQEPGGIGDLFGKWPDPPNEEEMEAELKALRD